MRDTASLWRAIENQLRQHLTGAETLLLDADAVVGPNGAAVVPRYILQEDALRALEEAGLAVVAGPLALSVGDGELKLGRSALDLDSDALAAFAGLLPPASDITLPESTPVAAWTFFDNGVEGLQQMMQRLMRALSLVSNGATVGAESTIDVLQRVLEGATAATAGEDLVDQLRAALGAD